LSITGEQRHTATVAVIAAAAWLIVHMAFQVLPAVFESWELRTADRLFALRSRLECSSMPCRTGLLHVDLTYSALREMPNRQITRSHYARVVDALATAGARAQLFDFVFASRTGAEDDSALVRAVSASSSSYFGLVLQPEPPQGGQLPAGSSMVESAGSRWRVQVPDGASEIPNAVDAITNFPELEAAARGLGFLNLTSDVDGVFRRTPLLIRHRDGFVPSLALRAAVELLGVRPEDILYVPGRHVRLPGAKLPGASSLRDVMIPIDSTGHYRINFVGPWEAYPHEPFFEVWRAARNPVALALLRDKITGRAAVVADVSTGSADIGPVPTDARYPLAGVHATVLDNILSASFVRDATAAEALAAELVLLVVAALMAGLLQSRRIPLATVTVGIAYVALVLVIFIYGRVVLTTVKPLSMFALTAFGVISSRFVSEQKARAVLRASFAAYFPPAVVDRIVRDPSQITAAGQRKEISTMFSDVKDFTHRCRHMPPEDIQRFLNRYFDAMIDLVFEYGGTVDKFIGDGLMVFFGDPEPQADHALRAVRCALSMQRRVGELSAALVQQGEDELAIRIGISTGVVVVGNMGSARRLSYTVLGTDVNLAHRLETNAPAGGVLISSRTYELVREHFPDLEARHLAVKGLEEEVTVFELPADERRSREEGAEE
jgi:adenylate cyclase